MVVQMSVANNKNQKVKKSKNILLIAIPLLALILVIIAFGISYYYYNEYNKIKADPNIVYQDESMKLLEQVGQLMELPSDEAPTIATVMDKEKLQDQEFFKKAENEDKLIVYLGAKKAILYRPSINKIIDFAPIIMDNNSDIPQIEDNTDDIENIEDDDETLEMD